MADGHDTSEGLDALLERLRRRLAPLLARPGAPARPAPASVAGRARLPAEAVRTAADLAPLIDHTLLRPDATRADVLRLVAEARTHGFATVCVNPLHVALAAEALAGAATRAIAVVGFPLGATLPAVKAFEAREAVRRGAREVDMVLALGALRGGEHASVLEDIAAVVEASAPHPVKVILETTLLTREEKVAGCLLAQAAGAAFVKTSTGFAQGGGATEEDVALLRRVVGDALGVKASGGIRSAADALRMVRAGASRLGASASVAIVTGGEAATRY